MKRFWLVLLSLGLIMAFSASAFAVDVKFSGSYYVAGMYMDKIAVAKTSAGDAGMSTAFYYQRLRVKTEFVVSPGLSLITSFDALERVLGGARTTPGVAADPLSAGTKAENQNIAFDNAYISYSSPVGTIAAGMMWGGPWGIQFGNTTTVKNRFLYIAPTFVPGLTLLALWDKALDKSYTTVTAATQADNDQDVYGVGGIYATNNFQFHLLFAAVRDASARSAGSVSYTGKYYQVVAAPVVQVGPVKIEGEVDYYFGKLREYEGAGSAALNDVSSWEAYLGAKADFGLAYVGGFVAYSQGQPDQDYTTRGTMNQVATGGTDWNPCLIMFNYDLSYWEGGIAGISGSFVNALMYQVNGGVRPIDKLDIGGSITYATRNEVAPGYGKNLGWEVDVTGTYKITNNLSYMLGVGYLFTGDYFKGAGGATETVNDFLVINKLALTF